MMAQTTTQHGGARRQQQEAEDSQQQQAPWTPPQIQTPSRFRTPDSKLARRGRAIAAEFSSQQKRRESHGNGGDSGYTFNFLPEDNLPVTPGVPGSARKRKDTIASSNADMMIVDESPARYSPDKVKEAIMSFADFLHFLEDNQQEHPLMSTIIQRFSELGTVIESQKRHIDRWKQKELDLAICEAQQNLDLIRNLGEVRSDEEESFSHLTTIQQQELQLASWQVEKQSWEEKYQLAVQEIENLKREGTKQIQQLTNQVADLRKTNANMEVAVRERQGVAESSQKENEQLRIQIEQFENERANIVQENSRLGEQQQQQIATLQQFEQEMKELKQMCQMEKQKADSLEQEMEMWKQKLQETEASTTELEAALENERREKDQQTGDMNQLVGKAHHVQAQFDVVKQEYEEKLQKQQDLIRTLETSRRELQQQLQHASEQYGDLLKRHESESALAMRQLEENFLHEKARLGDQVEQELRKLRHENDELRGQMESLKEVDQGKNAEFERLLVSHRGLEGQIRQNQHEDSEKMQKLEEELENYKAEYDQLLKEFSEKDDVHQEELRAQAEQHETQYNEFVTQVEGQLAEVNDENDQLRTQLEELDAERKRILHQAELLSVAKEDDLAKWGGERAQLQNQIQVFEREVVALRREVELRSQELELKMNENRKLTEQIGNYLSPNSERNQQVELLQRERIRLEDQTRDLRMQMERMQSEMNAHIQEADHTRAKAVEQESTHRQTIRNVYMEKEEADRNMMNLLSEKSTIQRQLNATTREKDEIMESVKRLEKEKQSVEAQLQNLMKQATEKIEAQQAQQQNTALLNQDAQIQLQKLKAELSLRDEQMSRGQQQLRTLQSTIQTLEKTNRQLQLDLEAANGRAARLKMDVEKLHSEKRTLESIQSADKTSNQLEKQRAYEELSATYEQYKAELMNRVLEEEEKAQQLHLQLSANDAQHADEIRGLTQELEEAQLARDQLQEACNSLEDEVQMLEQEMSAQAAIMEAARNLEATHNELQRAHEQLKNDTQKEIEEKSAAIAELEEFSANLQATLEREQERSQSAKSRTDSQVSAAAKSREVTSLKNQIRELELTIKQLRSKIQTDEEIRVAKEQSALHEKMQKEREIRSLQSRCDGLESEIRKVESELSDTTQHNEELERVMEENGLEIQRDLQRSEGIVVHSKLQQVQEAFYSERQQLQSKIDELQQARDTIHSEKDNLQQELDNADKELSALRRVNHDHIEELNRKDQELDQLKQVQEELLQDLDKKDEELDSFRHEHEDILHELEKKDEIFDSFKQENEELIHELDAKDETLKALQHANEEQAKELEKTNKELDELKQKNLEHANALANKDEELASVKGEGKEYRLKLVKIQKTLEELKRENEEQVKKLQLVEKRDMRQSQRLGDFERFESALQSRLTSLQKKYDQLLEREEDLTKEITTLKAEKMEIKDTIKRELRKLNVSDDSKPNDDNLIVRGDRLRLFELIQSFHHREARLDALLQRKDTQIASLKAQVDELKSSVKTNQHHYTGDVNDLNKEVEQMSHEVSKLKMENRKLRERSSESNNASSRPIIEEWKGKCAKLSSRLRELHDENSKLKQRQLSRTEMKRLVDEIDTLSSLVNVKDTEIQELKHKNASMRLKSSRSQYNSSSTSANVGGSDSRRMKELMLLVQQKEEKIMVLNDHMTELMNQSVKLQYENERYAVRFGALSDNASASGDRIRT